MKYHVEKDGREWSLEVEGGLVRVNGQAVRAELTAVPGTPLYQLALDGRSLVLAARRGEDGAWHLLLHGEESEVVVLDERARHIRDLVGTGRGHAGGGVVKAPMPGLVVRMLVGEGQRVSAGDGLVVLEAMKMENELKATGPAMVRRIAVATGSAVERGALLIELDPVPGPASGTA